MENACEWLLKFGSLIHRSDLPPMSSPYRTTIERLWDKKTGNTFVQVCRFS